MVNLFNNRWLIWGLLAIPSIPLVLDLFLDQRYYGEVMHRSGVWAAIFLIVSLLISPVRIFTKFFQESWRNKINPIVRWLLKTRRYFGLAAMSYGLIHTLFYIKKLGEFETILEDALNVEILTGWIALLVFILLGITSNNYSMKRMGRQWKKLHRFSYLSAILIFYHWYVFDYKYSEIYYWFVPLLLAQIMRIFYNAHQAKLIQTNPRF